MLTLNAVSISEALSLPDGSAIGHIITVHNDYINIFIEGRLLALFRSGNAAVPFGIEVDCKQSWLSIGLVENQSVRFLPNTIVIEDLLVINSLQQCPQFSCRLDTTNLHSREELLQRLHRLYEACLGSDKSGGIMDCLGSFDPKRLQMCNNFQNGLVQERVQQRVESLINGVLTNDDYLIVEGVCGLLGLGPGLTPSGDDFLLAFLSGLMHVQSEYWHSAATKMAHHMVINGPRLTTLVSVEYIKYGVKGLYHQRMSEMIAAFTRGTQEELLTKAQQVLKLGHFSGVDLLIGFIYGSCTALHLRTAIEETGGIS
jgi:hypothetical protein